MEKYLLKIWGVGLTVVLLVNLFLLAAPASAGTLAWSAESIPSIADNVLGPGGIDVRDIAIAADGQTIYITPADSLPGNIIYKSTDAGLSWTELSVGAKADLVAVAPDNANMVAIANSSTPVVYISTDGGSYWYNLGTPQESGGTAAAAIYDVAISAASDGVRCIAIAGKEAGDVANVWYFKVGSITPVWKETNNLTGFSSANLMKAVAFSPDFPSDEVMVAVSERDNLSIHFQILSFNSEKWNTSAGFSGYPVTIVADNGITDLTSASISLAPDYLGSDAGTRIAFVGLTVDGNAAAKATSDIYRLNDTSKKALKTGANIHSVAFNGTNLVAGAYDSSSVYRSTNPLATTPTVSATLSLKRPGGENKVVVDWAGSKVVAGTSGNESAFAISGDSGATFNDIAFIDTVITNTRDVAVSADGSKVYLVTDDGVDLSLWRYALSWERVLSKQSTTNYIVRISPVDSDVVYLAKKSAETIYYSKDGGKGKWLTRICLVNVQDLAIESNDVLYALSGEGKVSKSTNAGFTWGTAKSTEVDSGTGHMIVSVSENNLLVGSTNGYVAYSTDGNSYWSKIDKVIESGASNVQVIADENFATNRIIYAASDKAGQNIKKWTIGSSTDWSDIFRSTLAGGIYGLAVDGGILYALEFNSVTNQSALWLCLSPASAAIWSASWSSVTTTATTDADDATVHLNATPQALRVSSGDKLWAVKTNGTNKLYSFTAILTELTLVRPAPGFTSPVNGATGVADEIIFRWERLATATRYELYFARDQNFTELITTVTKVSSEATVVVLVGPRRTGSAKVSFMPGTIYYWRVRVTQPLYSLYSRTRSFTIEPIPALTPRLLTPDNGGTGISRTPSFSWEPVSGATEYRFVLADNVALIPPIVDLRVKTPGFAMPKELDYGRTYYWTIKPVTPIEGSWSVLANFMVKEEPAELVPPVVVKQVPPLLIDLPAPPPQQPRIVISPPPPPPAPIIPAYIWAIIIIGVALLIAVIMLIGDWTFRVPVVGGDKIKIRKVREALANLFQILRPVRVAVSQGEAPKKFPIVRPVGVVADEGGELKKFRIIRPVKEVADEGEAPKKFRIVRPAGVAVSQGEAPKKFRIIRPVRVAADEGEAPKKFPIVRPVGVAADEGGESKKFQEGQSMSFAAECFRWLTTSKERGEGGRMLSADEEQELGRIIVSRIQGIAADQLLYHKFPQEAALLLYIWSQYGSREETNRYLTQSFQSRADNVIEFLRCYLPDSSRLESGSADKGDFSRTQYNSIAEVVNPDSVFEALRRLYGPQLDTLEGEELGNSLDEVIAYQFARIHHLVKGEMKKVDKKDTSYSQV